MSRVPSTLVTEMVDVGLKRIDDHTFESESSNGIHTGVWIQSRRVVDTIEISLGEFSIWDELEKLIARGCGTRYRFARTFTVSLPEQRDRFYISSPSDPDAIAAIIEFVRQQMLPKLRALAETEYLQDAIVSKFEATGQDVERRLALSVLLGKQPETEAILEDLQQTGMDDEEVMEVRTFLGRIL